MVWKNHKFRWIEIRECLCLGEDNEESENFYLDGIKKNQINGNLIERKNIEIIR